MKHVVATIGPIAVAFGASKRDFQLYKSGMYTITLLLVLKIMHAMLVIGYGTDDDGFDYWLCQK